MEFDEIVKQQATHKLHHATKGGVRENLLDLSCQTCYPTKDIVKHERFDRFWGMIEQMDLEVEAYSGQTIMYSTSWQNSPSRKENPTMFH